MKLEATVDIAAPAAAVWAKLMDLEAAPAFVPFLERAELLTPAPPALGSRLRFLLNYRGQRVATDAVVTALDPEKRLAAVADVPEVTSSVTVRWDLTPVPAGTRVHQTVEIKFGSTMAQLGARAIMGDVLKDESVRDALGILQTAVEGGAPA
jgi:carbon monoxide dehydrogenase subunit G